MSVEFRVKDPNQPLGYTSIFVSEDNPLPVNIIGGGGSGMTTVVWAEIEDKPTTFPPVIGTTATTAAAGNHTHTIPSIVGLPEFVLNHEQDAAEFDRRIGELETANAALEARIEALEGA